MTRHSQTALVALIVLLTSHQTGRAFSPAEIRQQAAIRSHEFLNRIPLAFEATAPGTFIARGKGYGLSLRPDRLAFDFPDAGAAQGSLEMRLVGASSRAGIEGEAATGGRSHYFIGNDPRRHRVNVPHFARVRVRQVYRGIDVVYYGNHGRLEYDFIVAPGADPAAITLRFDRRHATAITPEGDLILRSADREIRQSKPHVYQDDARTPLIARFRLDARGDVRFEVRNWDRSRPLIIDPVIEFSGYLGGTGADTGRGVAVDTSGNVFVAGTTSSTDFPAVSALQGTTAGGTDAFVTKINAAGTAIVYSTYLGGTGSDEGRGIAVDAAGSAYVTGLAGGTSFPHSGVLSTTCGSTDGFVTKLNAAGSAVDYSVCFGTGGSEHGNAISVDVQNVAHVTGQWNGGDVFLGALNATATAWVYSLSFGGSSSDEGLGMASDAAGNVCVAGRTTSSNFPTLNARQPSQPAGAFQSGFVAKYDAAGAAVFRTYLGGSGFDNALAAAIDASGNCYITGITNSTNFPTHLPSQPAKASFSDAFVTAYSSDGSAYLYSTYLGGNQSDSGAAIAATGAGVVHVAGSTASRDLPAVNPTQYELKDIGGARKSNNGAASFARTALAGTSVQALAIDPTDAQVMYAGTPAGIYKTTDGGGTWARVDSGLTYVDVRALAIDPNDHCVIFAGVATTVINGGFPGQILVQNTTAVLAASLDCGATWGVPIGGPAAKEARSLAFTNANPAALYATLVVNAASGGFSTVHHRVSRTVSGTTTLQFTFEDFNYFVAADRTDPCTAYLGGFSGRVQQNTSCGAFNWTQIGATLTGAVKAIAPHPSTTGAALAGMSAGRIYLKPDSVSPWSQVATLTGDVNAIVYQPGSSQVAYAGTTSGRVYKSIDGGLTWTLTSIVGPAIDALAVTPAATSVVLAGVRSDTDAFYGRLNATGAVIDLTWLGGYGTDGATGIALDPSSRAVIVGTTQSGSFPVTAGAFGAAAAGGGDVFVTRIDPAVSSGGPQMMQNGGFAGGLSNWLVFATDGTNPDNSYISANVVGGQLEFFRVPPPSGSNSAVVLQNTGVPVGAGEPLAATFKAGNSSSTRKRLSVLIHDQDFSDLSVCTFWIPANTPLQPYQMTTHTTEAWVGASISFYAASAGSNGGAYLLDDVVLAQAPWASGEQTTCHDPFAPAAPGGADGPELLTNGSFGTGDISGWTPFGLLVHQVSGGVFEFYRPAGLPTDPAGVILQPTGQSTTTGEIVTAQFELGNSSTVRKRVTVLLHDLNFTDLSACTFWLSPGQPLSSYTMRAYSTVPWPNLTLSVYAATVGTEAWMRLDNASMKRTPGQQTTGTDCLEPSWMSGFISDHADSRLAYLFSRAVQFVTTVSGVVRESPPTPPVSMETRNR